MMSNIPAPRIGSVICIMNDGDSTPLEFVLPSG
jgi:hypothetical protein